MARFTVRLPEDLRTWVKGQGGGEYVRSILERSRAHGLDIEASTLRPEIDLQNHWDHLQDERDIIAQDRELLDEEERLLDRQREHLERERGLLQERREQLEDEWGSLEQMREELECREQLLVGLFRPSMTPLVLLSLPGGCRV